MAVHDVDDATGLRDACDACAAAPAIALDTEFERSNTYYPRPALLQLAAQDSIWLVDPLAVDDLTPLGTLLASARAPIVMHAAQEDLEVLAIAAGCQPATLFDTQVAAALVGMTPGIGYHALVRELLGIALAKDQTRSDWLRRPLSAAQIRYAADDVTHLPALHAHLDARLRALGRETWLVEEMRRQLERGAADDAAARVLERIEPRLGEDDAARGRLAVLCTWREAEARRLDRPRRHVLDDDLLLAVARAAPRDRDALEALPQWQDRRARRRCDVDALTATLPQAADAAPRPMVDLAPHRRTLQAMRRAVAAAAAGLEMDASVLAPRRLLEKALVRVRVLGEAGLPEELRGWRAPFLEEPLMESLRDD